MSEKQEPYQAIISGVSFYARELRMSYGESRKMELHEGLKALCELVEAINWTKTHAEHKRLIREKLSSVSVDLNNSGYKGASSRVLRASDSVE